LDRPPRDQSLDYHWAAKFGTDCMQSTVEKRNCNASIRQNC
jgi:hypothetical protein